MAEAQRASERNFNEKKYEDGMFRLHDFRDGRHVKTVRILARAESDEATLKLFLNK